MEKKTIFLLCILTVLLVSCRHTLKTEIVPDTVPVTTGSEQPEAEEKETGNETADSGVWVMREPPAVRNEISGEQKKQRQEKILGKGKLLYAGDTDESFLPEDTKWLQELDRDGAFVLCYSCEDKTHAGWRVVKLTANTGETEFKVCSDEPLKERLVLIPVSGLEQLADAASLSEIGSFSLKAWNGGRINAFYYLPGEVYSEMQAYLAEVREYEQIIHTYDGRLSDPDAAEAAVNVYEYLRNCTGKNCLTGQMEAPESSFPAEEVKNIYSVTGKAPAVLGLDFRNDDFEGVTERAAQWWENGGIPMVCWHTGADFTGGYTECQETDLDFEKALTPGTAEYDALLRGMDRAAVWLKQLEEKGVPVLWKPFHELDGNWFWWSRGGAENFKRLWQLMYSRYTDFWGLDNLIWVLGYSSMGGGEMAKWYPGDPYVDVIGADSYESGAHKDLFEECRSVAPEGMPVVLHECGIIPTEQEMAETGARWTCFMEWYGELEENYRDRVQELGDIYNSGYFVTLDELPFR